MVDKVMHGELWSTLMFSIGNDNAFGPKNSISDLPFDSAERVNLMKEIRQVGGFKTAG